MKNTALFKTLVDTLYVLHFIGLIGMIFILPLGVFNVEQDVVGSEQWSAFYWVLALIGLTTYIIFLRGLFYLRKMASSLLSGSSFSERIISNLKKSGKHFLYTGVMAFGIMILLWIGQLGAGKLSFGYDANLLIPFFLMIIGTFFIIQSHTLSEAKQIKEENELTI